MHLSPVTKTQDTSSYPPRRFRRATWVRRALTAVIASAALTLGACNLIDDRPIEDDDIWDNEEIAGAMPAPSFWCGDEEPEYLNILYTPGSYDGELCGELTAWAAFDVAEQGIYRLSLTSGAEVADLALLDPEGDQLAQLDVDTPSVTVELTPGRWTLAVTAVDPVSQGWGFFMLDLEQL